MEYGSNNSSLKPTPRVVFMANDAVLKHVLVFLESFRCFNPHLKLSMIPFADDIAGLKLIRDQYDFDILDLDMRVWDSLAAELYPSAAQKYKNRLRKLSIFDVKGAPVIYLDIDMLILKDLAFLGSPIASGLADFVCTATCNDPWVYKESYKETVLKDSKRFSDGFFVFNPNTVSVNIALDTLNANKGLYLSVRADDVYSQPMTNFVVDMLRLNSQEVYRLFPDISPQVWYASTHLSQVGDKVVAADGKEVLFVHWAGPVNLSSEFRFKDLFGSFLQRGIRRAQTAGVKAELLA